MNAREEFSKTLNLITSPANTNNNFISANQNHLFNLITNPTAITSTTTTPPTRTTSTTLGFPTNYPTQSQSEALASLFHSLSNLANEQNRNVLAASSQTFTQQDIKPTNLSLPRSSSNSNTINNHQISPSSLTSQLQTSQTSSVSDQLANTIQSAVAAALIQQQYNASLKNQQQTIPKLSELDEPNPSISISAEQKQSQTQHQQQQPPIFQQCQQEKATFSAAPVLPVQVPPAPAVAAPFYNGNFRNNFEALSQTTNLDHNQQSPLIAQQIFQSGPSINQLSHLQSTNNTQQRINYCTICNKELCNKYFMKTHMLKMHGINLELEQSADNDNNSNNSANDSGTPDGLSKSESNENHQSSLDHSNDDSSQTKLNKATSSVGSVRKQTGPARQATSVMNGFAGNSMGGVVCDICNKELCSKYFLKVHKQNTHGIMTDYQDPSQFMYPFANPLAAAAAPNPFDPLAAAVSMGLAGQPPQPPLMMFGGGGEGSGRMHSTMIGGDQHQQLQREQATDYNGKKTTKKARLMKTTQIIGSKEQQETSHVRGNQTQPQLDAIYKMMLGQQQQQPNEQQYCLPTTGQPVTQTPYIGLDPMNPSNGGANPFGALMYFGRMTPYGPAGIPPAMVVDMILRNQHLFNRKNSRDEQANLESKDKNNNDSAACGSGGAKPKGNTKIQSDKNANNSRYFSHYTEACPMCERRFKSIKWLKTHMMNDHKQEIGAHMQMMMQCMYGNKNQPLGATMASSFGQPPMPQLNFSNLMNQMQLSDTTTRASATNQNEQTQNILNGDTQQLPQMCDQQRNPCTTNLMHDYLERIKLANKSMNPETSQSRELDMRFIGTPRSEENLVHPDHQDCTGGRTSRQSSLDNGNTSSHGGSPRLQGSMADGLQLDLSLGDGLLRMSSDNLISESNRTTPLDIRSGFNSNNEGILVDYDCRSSASSARSHENELETTNDHGALAKVDRLGDKSLDPATV